MRDQFSIDAGDSSAHVEADPGLCKPLRLLLSEKETTVRINEGDLLHGISRKELHRVVGHDECMAVFQTVDDLPPIVLTRHTANQMLAIRLNESLALDADIHHSSKAVSTIINYNAIKFCECT